MRYAEDLNSSSVLSGSYSKKAHSATIISNSPHPHKCGNTVCAFKLVGGADTLNESKSRGNTHYSLRLDRLEIFSGVNKGREPVIREDVRGNLLPYVVSRQ